MNFTLQPGRWYGWQMIPGYTGERCVPFCCPCRVLKVTPQKSGKGLLRLEVWVTGYAEGVNFMKPILKVIHHGQNYLIARLASDPVDLERCVVISHIEFEWVRRFCPELWNHQPPESLRKNVTGSITAYLDEVFRAKDDWRPDLVCNDVIYCALRFDGGKLDQELEARTPTGSPYGNFAALHDEHFAGKAWQLHPDPLVNWGEFFWLQRSEKWSGLDREASRLMAWLFTQLHDEEPPPGYKDEEYASKYQPHRARAKALAQEWQAHLS